MRLIKIINIKLTLRITLNFLAIFLILNISGCSGVAKKSPLIMPSSTEMCAAGLNPITNRQLQQTYRKDSGVITTNLHLEIKNAMEYSLKNVNMPELEKQNLTGTLVNNYIACLQTNSGYWDNQHRELQKSPFHSG